MELKNQQSLTGLTWLVYALIITNNALKYALVSGTIVFGIDFGFGFDFDFGFLI